MGVIHFVTSYLLRIIVNLSMTDTLSAACSNQPETLEALLKACRFRRDIFSGEMGGNQFMPKFTLDAKISWVGDHLTDAVHKSFI